VPRAVADPPDAVVRHHRADRALAFLRDPGVPRVERDPKLVDAARVSRQAAIAEVHAEEVDVGRRQGTEVVRRVAVAA
jgi:hypothetical protein